MLYVKKTKSMGRGVFSDVAIKKGDVFDTVPLLLIPNRDEKAIGSTVIANYYFWVDDDWLAIALGYGSLYNHSRRPNADWRYIEKDKTFDFYAVRNISAGAQIFVDYGYDPSGV